MNTAPRSLRTCAFARLAALALLIGAMCPVHAEDAALARFGRLFHTPEQRLQLDTGQPRRAPPRDAIPAHSPARAPAAPRTLLRLDGILRRSDGHDSVWLNGELQPVPPGFQLAPGQRRELVPTTAPRVRLRVGDSWPIATEVSETPTLRANPPAGVTP